MCRQRLVQIPNKIFQENALSRSEAVTYGQTHTAKSHHEYSCKFSVSEVKINTDSRNSVKFREF